MKKPIANPIRKLMAIAQNPKQLMTYFREMKLYVIAINTAIIIPTAPFIEVAM